MNETLKAVRDSVRVSKGEGSLPIILTGITCDPPEIFDLFDEIKLNVVADTLVTGSRYLEGIVDEAKDSLDALTERHFKRGFYSPIHDDVFKNAKDLATLYRTALKRSSTST